MRSAVKSFHSPDVEDLDTLDGKYALDDFGIFVQVIVGPAGARGQESFDVMVCSPAWLSREVKGGPVMGRHHIFLEKWDLRIVERELRKLFEIEGRNWERIAAVLARHGHWEFEDYKGA